jgi:hypothetical protein
MKTKTIILLAVSAIVTLSFTFASVKTQSSEPKKPVSQQNNNEPAGGFAAEDKF